MLLKPRKKSSLKDRVNEQNDDIVILMDTVKLLQDEIEILKSELTKKESIPTLKLFSDVLQKVSNEKTSSASAPSPDDVRIVHALRVNDLETT